MTFRVVEDDIFKFKTYGQPDAIGHGVNCKGIMGAGFAKLMRTGYPEDMFMEYNSYCNKFGPSLAGLAQYYKSYRSDVPSLYNMFTQVFPGKNGDYSLIEKAALAVRLHGEATGLKTMYVPALGCGIAGLELHNVQHILTIAWSDSVIDFTMFVK